MARPIGAPKTYWRGDTQWIRWTEPGKGQQRRRLTDVEPDCINTPYFCQHIVTYLAWHEEEYPAHYPRVESIIRVHLAPAFGNLQLDKITPELVAKYKKQRRQRGAKPGTINKELRTLNAVLNHAVTWDVLQKNPIAKKVKPAKDPDAQPNRYYSEEQLQKLYAQDTRWTDVWRFMANTGLRMHEMRNLKAEHVGDNALYVISTPESPNKTSSWRTVTISDHAQDALSRLLLRDHLCPRVTDKSMCRAFKREAKRAGLPGSLHWLRHTYCSHQVMSGTPLVKVKALAGHSSFKTTLNYVHLTPGYLATGVINI